MVSELHQWLKDAVVQGINGEKIDLFQRFAEIKAKASTWLANHGKNGIEHSERLEEYLVKLTQKPCHNGRISIGEIFILLCAAYLHDIGYWHNDKLDPVDHPQRSHDRILADPGEYLLGDFPLFGGSENLTAKAIALVCRGHSDEIFVPLNEIPKEFADQNLCPDRPMNLRMLAALLRLADETDDPYVRIVGGAYHAIRSETPLVVIRDETIAWYWQNSKTTDPGPFLKNLEEKKTTLRTATGYLYEIQCGTWYLVLHPQVPGSAPFMAEKPTETFVGREDDLAKIHTIIQQSRAGAITGVVGTGGIGKTELARMYAERYQNQYPDGVFWASLKGSSWKNEAPKILVALRPGADPMAFPDNGQAREAITKTLDRNALLVIDNVDEYDDIIKPACRVLVTTRNRDAFGMIPHDAVHRLDKLEMEAALALLSELIGSVRVQQDHTGAERIVEILGGMPLALEISTCHLADAPSLGFPEYIGFIQNKIERLTIEESEDKNVLASLELSLEGLVGLKNTSEILALFEASAVCAAAGFTAKTLIAAAGLGHLETVLCEKLVGKLFHRSLLEFHKETNRYSLHALVRQLAETKLRENEDRRKRFAQNHCGYFVRYASAYRNDPAKIIEEKDGLWQAMVQTNQVAELRNKFPRLLEAIAVPYWEMISRKNYEDCFNYLTETNIILLNKLAKYKNLLQLLNPLAENSKCLKESSQQMVFLNIGTAYAQLGKYKDAEHYCMMTLETARRMGDALWEGNALNNIGIVYDYRGQHKKSRSYYQEALDAYRKVGHKQGEVNALNNLGIAHRHLKKFPIATKYHQQSIEIARQIGDVRGEGSALHGLGQVFADRGKSQTAIGYYEQHLDICRQIGDDRGIDNALGNIANAYYKLGKYETAIECYEHRLALSRRLGHARGVGNSLCDIGRGICKVERL